MVQIRPEQIQPISNRYEGYTLGNNGVNAEWLPAGAYLNWKNQVHAATTPAVGNIGVFFPGSATQGTDGQGDLLLGVDFTLGLDGVPITLDSRILVKDQTLKYQNGIWKPTIDLTGTVTFVDPGPVNGFYDPTNLATPAFTPGDSFLVNGFRFTHKVEVTSSIFGPALSTALGVAGETLVISNGIGFPEVITITNTTIQGVMDAINHSLLLQGQGIEATWYYDKVALLYYLRIINDAGGDIVIDAASTGLVGLGLVSGTFNIITFNQVVRRLLDDADYRDLFFYVEAGNALRIVSVSGLPIDIQNETGTPLATLGFILGVYNTISNIASTVLVRTNDFDTTAKAQYGSLVFIAGGAVNNERLMVMNQTTALDWAVIDCTWEDFIEIQSTWKDTARTVSKGDINGTYVAQVITGNVNGVLVVDGVTMLAGDRVLLVGQTIGTENGIYDVVDPGTVGTPFVISRSPDFAEFNGDVSGTTIFVSEGVLYKNTVFAVFTDEMITLDVTAVYFQMIYPPVSAFKEPVRAASVGNINTAAPGAAIDGVALAAYDRVLLKDQTLPEENGIWHFVGAAIPMVRPIDFNDDFQVQAGARCYVLEGTENADAGYLLTTNENIVLGTTGLVWAKTPGVRTITQVTWAGGLIGITGGPATSVGIFAHPPLNASDTSVFVNGVRLQSADWSVTGLDLDILTASLAYPIENGDIVQVDYVW